MLSEKITRDALKTGKYKEAIPDLLKLLKTEKNNPNILCKIGIIYDHIAQTSRNPIINWWWHHKAFLYYKKALQRNSSYKPALLGIGRIFWHKNKTKKALFWYFKALEKHPNNPTILNSVANTYKANKQYDKASEFFEKALSIKESFGVCFNYAKMLNDIGKKEKAHHLFEKGLILSKKENLSDMEKKTIYELEQKIKTPNISRE